MSKSAGLIAILAGAACILLIAAAGRIGPGGALLLLLAPFPIYIAAFGWGTRSALIASIAAIIGAGVSISANAAIVIGLLFSIPASIIGHQANLAQMCEEGAMEWYPLERLFLNLCVVLAVGFTAMLIYFGYEDTKAQALPIMGEALDQIMAQNPVFSQLSVNEITELKESTFNFLPFWAAGLWLIIHIININFAAFVCRASDLMPRPKDDLGQTVHLPMIALGFLIVSIVLAWFADGKLQYYVNPFLGVMLTGFSLAGLAMLHFRARSSGTHFVLLMLSYAMIILFYLPLFVFAGAGILRTLTLSKNTLATPE